MRFNTFFYSLKQGLINIKRNKMFSLASIATIATCIFLIGLFYAIVSNFNYMIDEAKDTVCITVFFDEDVTTDQIDDITEKIEKRVEVSKVTQLSADEAWEEFKYDYFGDDSSMMEIFDDDNPLKNSASLTIYMNDISMQDSLVTYLKATDGIRKVNASPVAANTLTDFGKLVGFISVAIIAVLLAIGIFLISNTVMIGIAVRKEEIGIMKLIGATDYFVKSPFIVEGIIIGCIGTVIPIIALYFIYKSVVSYVVAQFSTLSGILVLLEPHEIFSIFTPMAFVIGAGIGFLGSMITIRKHLKV